MSRQLEGSGPQLSDEHLAKIRSSALSGDHASALGWNSLHNGRLLIRYLRSDGTPETDHDGAPFTRERLGDAEIRELQRHDQRKPGRYRSSKGQGCRIYHSHLALQVGNYMQRLADPFTPLRITEGELKTEAANVHDPDRLTIGLGGVNSWRDRYDDGETSQPLVDFDEITLDGREVRLCFDSDLDKPQVAAALRQVAEYLQSKGAQVLVEVLPNGLDGKRLGIDDLIFLHGPAAFHEVAAIARSPFKARRQKGETVFEWNFNREPADTRERNAYLAAMIGREWRFDPNATDRWQHWTGTHWEDVSGNDTLCRTIELFITLQGWRNRELPTIRSLLAAFRRTIEPASEHGTHDLLPFRNGCLQLGTGVLVTHRPEHGNVWALPYDYDPAARCDRLQEFLLDRLEDHAAVAVFRSFARGLLLGEPYKGFVEISGPSNTGKSVLEAVLIALVGARNVAAGKLHRLEDPSHRFESLKLRGKRLAVFSEAHGYSGPLEMLKALTGGDPIGAEIKGGQHVDFIFRGGVVLVGNGPIRPSDTSGAVITRRRSLHVGKVVAAKDELKLLEPDGAGGWTGELAHELPGFVNWCLAMTKPEARAAMARDVPNLHRAEAELQTLLDTDLLAQWADLHLSLDETATGLDSLRVGGHGDLASQFLFPNYLEFIAAQGPKASPLALRNFKAKLVDLLRDTLGLPMPAGRITANGLYRIRGVGSVIPCLKRKHPDDDEVPGVVRQGFLSRLGTAVEWRGQAEIPAGKGRNGKSLSDEFSIEEGKKEPSPSGLGTNPHPGETVPVLLSITSNPCKGSADPGTFPHRSACCSDAGSGSEFEPPPPHAETPIAVDGQLGWLLPGSMPKGNSPTVNVLVVDPQGRSCLVQRSRITVPPGETAPGWADPLTA